MLLFLVAVGAALLIARAASADAGDGDGSRTILTPYDPNDPLGSWKKAMETGAAQSPSLPQGPVGESGLTKAEEDAWIKFYKNKGHTYIPPEYPIDPSDVGAAGDLPDMALEDQSVVVQALFEESQASRLFELADDIEELGYPLAANRLRQKALRLVATT